MQVTRVALSPFDTRTELSTKHAAACTAEGAMECAERKWVDRLVGEHVDLFTCVPGQMILLSRQGFGLNLRRTQYEIDAFTDHARVAEMLLDRSAHHREMRHGRHEDAKRINRVKERIASDIDRKQRRDMRPDLWPQPPYTLSFFYVPAPAASLLTCDNARRGMLAVLEPSQVLRSELAGEEDRFSACCKAIGDLVVGKLSERYRDSDIKAGSATFCSWAGIVVCDGSGTDLPYFESLEIRLQLAWLRASLVRRWAEVLMRETDQNPEHLTRFAGRIAPLVRRSRLLIDATASTRDQALFDELVTTSELMREMEGAEEALGEVRNQIELARGGSRRQYDKTVEALLFVVAVVQIVPLFYDVPFMKLAPWTAIAGITLLTVFAVIRWLKT